MYRKSSFLYIRINKCMENLLFYVFEKCNTKSKFNMCKKQ